MEALKEVLKQARQTRTISEKILGESDDGAIYRAEMKEREHRKKLENAGIFKRFQDVTFETIEARGLPKNQSIEDNYEKIRAYTESLEELSKQGKGLILAGSFGTMKTTLAVAVLRQWLEKGHYGLFVPMATLIDNLFTMRDLNKEEWARYERNIRNTSLLALDDLGAENTDQGWILAKVDSIITERYNRMLPVIITTNKSKEELAGTYGGRIIDRLRSTCQFLEFAGKSERVNV